MDSPLTPNRSPLRWSCALLADSDYHVRRLAGGLLSRLEPSAVAEHAIQIAERLESDDETVRLHVVQALGLLQGSQLVPFADQLVSSLEDDDDGVRWAAVDALSALPPAALANRTDLAIQKMLDRQENSLARSAVSTWQPKLEGGGAPQAALDKLASWNFKLNFQQFEGQQEQHLQLQRQL
jgi:HEAT repeat protein